MRAWMIPLLLLAGAAQAAAPRLQTGVQLVEQSADGSTRLALSPAAPPPAALLARLKNLPELLGDEDFRPEPLRAGAPVLEVGGRLRPLTGFDYVQRARLSRDGRVALLGAGQDGGLDAWRIGRDGKRERLLPKAAAAFSGVIDASADGNTVVGWLQTSADAVPQGFVWQATQGYRLLPEPLWLPFAISADGTRLFASTRRPSEAALARRALSRTLQGPAEGEWGETLAVSADMKTAVGYYYVRPATGNPSDTGSYRGWWWQADGGYRQSARALHLDEASAQDTARFAAFSDQLLALAGLGKEASETVSAGIARWRVGEPATEQLADVRPVLFAREGALTAWRVWQNEAWQLRLAHGDETIAAERLAGQALGQVFSVRASADGRALQLAGEGGQVVLRRSGKKFEPPRGLHNLGAFSRTGRYYLWPDGEGFDSRHPSWRDLQSGREGTLAKCPSAGGHYSELALRLSADAKTLALGGLEGYCVYRTGLEDDGQ
ncbi:hypothetical protein EGI20_08755 [Aquitalea sp. S1-19]|nr:hypothetical protein [Aquitalea sp. S1-19]